MKLTIKDLKTSRTYDIPEEGVVMGRDKKNTDLPVRDESVSKQHARIYYDDGAWWLEDLGSSNGTYFKNKTITQAVELYDGAFFSLAQRQFEVVVAEGAEAAAGPSDDTEAEAEIEDIPPPPAAPEDAPPKTAAARRKRSPKPHATPDEPGEGDALGAAGAQSAVAYLLVAVPKAFAYYLAAAPLMLLNPMGTVRKGISEQKMPAMGRMELMAYAIPAFVFAALLGQIFGFVAALIAGSFAISLLIPGLPIAVVIGIVAGVVSGYIFDPLTEWIVKRLGGRSDARSRSNYAVMMFTVAIVMALPNSLGALIAAIPLPFINLLGPLLMLAATAVALYVAYAWVRAFEMIKWVQYVVLVLGALAVLGTVANLARMTVSSIRGFGSGGGAEVAQTEGDEGEAITLTEEQLAALEQAQANGAPQETIDGLRAGFVAQQKALQAAQKAAEGADSETGDNEKINDKKGDEGAAATVQADPDNEQAPAQAAASEGGEERGDEGSAARAAPTRASAEPLLPHPGRAPEATPFLEYQARLQEIESALKSDPSLIRKARVLKLYENLLKRSYDARQKTKKKKLKPWEGAIQARRRDLAVYESTRAVVDKLYRRLFGD